MMNATRTRISNWRNRRTLARGRRPRLTQAAGQVRSRTPLYRDRVNRATGRPHRDDRELGRTSDASLARTKALNARIDVAEPRLERQRQEPARARQHAREPGRPCGEWRLREPWESGPDAYRPGRSR